EHRVGQARTYVENYLLKTKLFFVILPVILMNYRAGRMEEAKIILVECFAKDPIKTKDVFVRYPELMNVPDFVSLTQ
ncbi:MAG: hypothetical protein ACEQR5_08230, partial [Moraxellaceae bacterium]